MNTYFRFEIEVHKPGMDEVLILKIFRAAFVPVNFFEDVSRRLKEAYEQHYEVKITYSITEDNDYSMWKYEGYLDSPNAKLYKEI